MFRGFGATTTTKNAPKAEIQDQNGHLMPKKTVGCKKLGNSRKNAIWGQIEKLLEVTIRLYSTVRFSIGDNANVWLLP